MAILDDLETLLRSDSRFTNKNGQLLKPLIQDAITKLDTTLISALLASPTIKEHFFKEINGVTIFNQEKFMWVVNSKEFLPDSYTNYRNKIGLSTNDHDLLTSSNAVSLVWPYKDCVLEGGQDKVDDKRNEIFYNETLAPDEVHQLLAPKAFCNPVRYTAENVEEITTFNVKDNLIIKGNNLLALSSLLKRYEGKVKCIYIDPPYFFLNRRGEDTFSYNTNFHMSTWLTFMKTRLQIAKRLLKSDGTIWVSINDEGMHYLKILADSIFDADCFVATLPRRTRSGKSDVKYNLSQDFDWVLLYTNSPHAKQPVGRKIERKYHTSPDFPGRQWRIADLTKQTTAQERPNSFFTMVDPKTGKKYNASEKRTWAVTADTFQHYYDAGYIVFPDDYDFLNISKPVARKFKDEDESTGKLSAIISDLLIRNFLDTLLHKSKNKQGNKQVDNLFSRDDFSYAKPEELIEAIIKVSTSPGDLVLDFFLGSGTTAAVAHKMGRHYIGIEQMDYISSITVPRLQKVLEGEQGGISKSQNWHGGGSFVYVELAEQSETLMGALQDSTNKSEVLKILNLATARGLLRPSVLPTDISVSSADFEQLTLDEQKRIVAELIDKNRLYINAADSADPEFNLSEQDITFTKSFYGEIK